MKELLLFEVVIRFSPLVRGLCVASIVLPFQRQGTGRCLKFSLPILILRDGALNCERHIQHVYMGISMTRWPQLWVRFTLYLQLSTDSGHESGHSKVPGIFNLFVHPFTFYGGKIEQKRLL